MMTMTTRWSDEKQRFSWGIELYSISQVYFNYEKGATTVVWGDGTKTTVRCQNGEDFDEEKAIALCYAKRICGNTGKFNTRIRKAIDGAQVISKKKKNKKTKRNWIIK